MSRDEAIAALRKEFTKTYKERLLSDGTILAVVGPLRIPGGDQKTKVAIKLPDPVSSRPQIYVETKTTLNTGGQPANVSNADVEGESWKQWSFDSPWNPDQHDINQLVYAALHIFNR